MTTLAPRTDSDQLPDHRPGADQVEGRPRDGAACPCRVPGGTAGFITLALVQLLFVVVGSIGAVFPGLIENLLGVGYSLAGPVRRRALVNENAEAEGSLLMQTR